MLVRDILQEIEFGKAVAELDQDLPNYFVVTDPFNRLIRGSADMIMGGKGTGKTAIYHYIQQVKRTQPELRNIQIIAGINPSGEPLFRRFAETQTLTEGQYVTVWKIYFLSLVSNWVVKHHSKPNSRALEELEALLSKIGLLSNDGTAGSIFPRLIGWIRENMRPTTVGMDITVNESGFPVYTPKIEFGPAHPGTKEANPDVIISPHQAFSLLETVLAEREKTVWVIMDRLDESFIGRPDIEIPALRALVRTFMDLIEFPHIRIKLFVRSDLFRKITRDGFVNLTHVNARKTEIIWDDDDLMALVCQRIRNNHELLRLIGMNRARDAQLFHTFFPDRLDPNRGQSTWNWMLSQIRDGNGVKAPRNLIDLCIFAQDEQMRKERRSSREFAPGVSMLEPVSIKQAAARLGALRLEDTLLAEYSQDVKVLINAFRNSKAEHNDQSLAGMFNVHPDQARLYARALMDIGFFEAVGDTYKIPFLYRSSLNITQGKAYNNFGRAQKR